MIVIKTARELSKMRDAGRISSRALRLAGEAVEPGVTTLEIDTVVRKYIQEQGASVMAASPAARVSLSIMRSSMAYQAKNALSKRATSSASISALILKASTATTHGRSRAGK